MSQLSTEPTEGLPEEYLGLPEEYPGLPKEYPASTQGDDRYILNERVECVLVSIDDNTQITRLNPCIGDIIAIHTEPVAVNHPDFAATYQGQYASALDPPALVGGDYDNQHRVVGIDLRPVSALPWATSEIPPYYQPRSGLPVVGVSVYVPIRHVICHMAPGTPQYDPNMRRILGTFFRRAPYGWSVLYHEPHEGSDQVRHEPSDVTMNTLNESLQDVMAHADSQSATQKCTRRVIGEVVDFGVDYDGIVKVICRYPGTPLIDPPPVLDMYMFHGPFAEVAWNYPNDVLFKLPYDWIHDAYDCANLGPQSYQAVIRHLLCNTLQRFRVKTVKFQETEDVPFYYGFTEDGFHFARNGRMQLATEVPTTSRPDPRNVGWELRNRFYHYHWLNLRKFHNRDGTQVPVKRGYIIYGRMVERQETGQTTLEWCTPPHGLDLLRVYVATNGKSPIFCQMTNAQLMEKLRASDGSSTLASQLFEGLIDSRASNPAIDYIKNELMWA